MILTVIDIVTNGIKALKEKKMIDKQEDHSLESLSDKDLVRSNHYIFCSSLC